MLSLDLIKPRGKTTWLQMITVTQSHTEGILLDIYTCWPKN